MDSFNREKEARVAAERLQSSLSEDLKRAQQDIASSNQKVLERSSLDLMKLYFVIQ